MAHGTRLLHRSNTEAPHLVGLSDNIVERYRLTPAGSRRYKGTHSRAEPVVWVWLGVPSISISERTSL
jgi:hypothetical protein